MKIVRIDIDQVRVNHRGDWFFVHIRTDEGLSGLGELNPQAPHTGSLEKLRELSSALIGRDPTQIERFVADTLRQSSDCATVHALSAVEPALWDLLGKSLNTPVYRLLGGVCHEEMRLYANINRATTDRTPEGFAKNAAAAVADGFDAVKLAPFDGMPFRIERAGDAQPGIACMQAVREAIGPKIDLLVDCHSHFTTRGALDVADALRDLDLYWFEEPVPDEDIEGYRVIKEQCGMTVAGGETRRLIRGFWEMMDASVVDVIMPDITMVGGLAELKKISALAEARSILSAPHGPFGPVMLAASLQSVITHPGFLIMEYAWGEVPWRHDLVLPAETILNGRMVLSDRPGLGVLLNPDVVRTHRVSVP